MDTNLRSTQLVLPNYLHCDLLPCPQIDGFVYVRERAAAGRRLASSVAGFKR